MNGLPTPILLACTLVFLAGCIGDGDDQVLSIDATGFVGGLVYFDANGNRVLDAGDPPVSDVEVRLIVRTTPDTAARVDSDANGTFAINNVPVGTYDIAVNPSTIADSVQVVEIEPPQLTVQRDDSVAALIAVSFPRSSVAEARASAPGERVFVDGVALNARSTFGDETVHILGGGIAIRATRVRATGAVPGDSVRFLGTTASLAGQPVLDDVEVFVLGVGDPPQPVRITTADAASADGGSLDAVLAEVIEAIIGNVFRQAGQDATLTVDDGSGELEIVLDQDIEFAEIDSLTVGTTIDAVGLLVPAGDGSGTWRLKPRRDQDIEIK